MFLFGWVVFGILLMDFYAANTIQYEGLMKEMPNILLIFISQLLTGFLFAYIFEKWAGYRTFGKGFQGGLIIGFLIIVAFDLYFLAGFHLFNVKLIVFDIILNTIFYALAGGIVGLVLGAGKK